jgi:hypothetical protein
MSGLIARLIRGPQPPPRRPVTQSKIEVWFWVIIGVIFFPTLIICILGAAVGLW